MRPSLRDRRPRNWTFFHDPSLEQFRLSSFFPFAAGYSYWTQSLPTDNFIFGDVAPYNLTFPRDWRTVSDTDISNQLTMIFNSIRHVTIASWSIANGKTFKPLRCSLLDDHLVPWENYTREWFQTDACNQMNFITAVISRRKNIYQASPVWITLLLLSSLVLFLLSILTVVLEIVTCAPDILSYVLTMMRDNSHVNLLLGATALDGPNQARTLRDLRMQLTDVRTHEDVGYVVLRSVEVDELRSVAGNLRKHRLYE